MKLNSGVLILGIMIVRNDVHKGIRSAPHFGKGSNEDEVCLLSKFELNLIKFIFK